MNEWRVRSDWNQNGSQEIHHYAVKTQSLNVLYHYGVKGMKWGVRRTPEQLGHKNLRKSYMSNVEKWGQSAETNVLYITGMSGSS